MTTEAQAVTGQPNTAPATQQPAAGTGTAPAEGSQTQQTQAAQPNAGEAAAAATGAPADGQTNKPADGQQDGQAASKAPEQYADFTVPDGYDLGELGNEFKTVAKELGLTQEQAQKLIDLDVKRFGAQTESVQKATAKWLEDAQADKEFGGEALTENVAIAKKAIDTFGSDALKDLLQKTGLGNHPELIRVFYRAGKAISEDRFVNGATGDNAQVTTAQRMYPNMNP